MGIDRPVRRKMLEHGLNLCKCLSMHHRYSLKFKEMLSRILNYTNFAGKFTNKNRKGNGQSQFQTTSTGSNCKTTSSSSLFSYNKCQVPNAQMHKCTIAQMHKCTNAQLHTCTNAQMHKCTKFAQMHKCFGIGIGNGLDTENETQLLRVSRHSVAIGCLSSIGRRVGWCCHTNPAQPTD